MLYRLLKRWTARSILSLTPSLPKGPVFWVASVYGIVNRVVRVHLITRAKKNIVAFLDPPTDTPGKRGRKRKYGEKVTLIDLFKEKANEFIEATC